jgi:hypothetical protein
LELASDRLAVFLGITTGVADLPVFELRVWAQCGSTSTHRTLFEPKRENLIKIY